MLVLNVVYLVPPASKVIKLDEDYEPINAPGEWESPISWSCLDSYVVYWKMFWPLVGWRSEEKWPQMFYGCHDDMEKRMGLSGGQRRRTSAPDLKAELKCKEKIIDRSVSQISLFIGRGQGCTNCYEKQFALCLFSGDVELLVSCEGTWATVCKM